jgi:NADH-quinone oxidoreductase subunit K
MLYGYFYLYQYIGGAVIKIYFKLINKKKSFFLNFYIFIITMILIQLISNISVFLCALLGILVNQKSILDILMSIELLLLSANLNFLIFSIYLDDYYGQIFSLFILTVAASEASVGLALLILLYRMKNTISVTQKILIKG